MRVLRLLSGIVEQHAERVTVPAAQPADAVAHVGPIEPARSPDGAMAGGDHDRFTLRGNDYVRCALSPRALLDQHELASLVVAALLAEREDHLEGKEELAVQVLVQAVEIAGSIAQQNRCGSPLPACMAELEEGAQVGREFPWLSEVAHPLRGDGCQATIERLAQFSHDAGQRIGEVLVLAPAEAVALHLDAAAEQLFFAVPAGNCLTRVRAEQRTERSEARRVQSLADFCPLNIFDVLLKTHGPETYLARRIGSIRFLFLVSGFRKKKKGPGAGACISPVGGQSRNS